MWFMFVFKLCWKQFKFHTVDNKTWLLAINWNGVRGVFFKGELKPILREFHINNYITWIMLVGLNVTHAKYFY